MQLNYFGALRLILKLLPVMRERRDGHIINVSSIGVQTNMPRFSAYVASKSALDAFSRCIASEIFDDGVRDHDDQHAARADPDDRADEDVRPLPDDHARRGGGHDLRGDHPQPKRIATPMGTLGQILYAINPKSIDYILNTAYHLFPDSSAAKGEKKKSTAPGEVQTTDDEATRQQLLFANLMRGVHW